jgi:hypothetical protein
MGLAEGKTDLDAIPKIDSVRPAKNMQKTATAAD